MAKVLGVGGVFVQSADPKALREWYGRVLGFAAESWGGVIFPSLPAGGQTVWSAAPVGAKNFAPSTRDVMLNYVVDDLEGVLARAAAEGVEAQGRTEDEYGKFAWVMDPDGRKVELWEAPPVG